MKLGGPVNHKKKILVIDDDPAVRLAFKLVLEDGGYNVRVAECGLDGIELAKQERPDLIFLDLKMPGIDGVETLRRLKAHDSTFNVYIVTAFSQEYLEELQSVRDEGWTFELASKPLSSEQIRSIARIVETVEAQETRRANQYKLVLTLYVCTLTREAEELVDKISGVLSVLYPPGRWVFDVVEVLGMPEKALERDVFATPMLVRDIPPPVLKLLGDLSHMPSVMAAITTQNSQTGPQTIIL